MRNSDLLLFFFIIYDIIITFVFLWIWNKTKEISNKKDKYIEELIHERDKIRLEKNNK